jgi:hypothetical protein
VLKVEHRERIDCRVPNSLWFQLCYPKAERTKMTLVAILLRAQYDKTGGERHATIGLEQLEHPVFDLLWHIAGGRGNASDMHNLLQGGSSARGVRSKYTATSW